LKIVIFLFVLKSLLASVLSGVQTNDDLPRNVNREYFNKLK